MENKDYLDNVNARLELLGIPNTLSFGSQFVSGARVLMFNHHLAQAMVLNNPEFNRIFTGEENKLMAYDINESERKFDCEILQIIPKYEPTFPFLKGGVESCPEFYIIVRTIEPNGVSHLDYFLVKKYMMGMNGFGYLTEQQNRHPRRVGDILYKEDPITHSPRVKGEQYCMGTNLNVAYGTFPETIEDAFVISESAAKKLEATSVRQIIIDVRQDRRPLNLYGDEFTEKLLPDIGEYVRDDGVLCGFRPTHLTTCVADVDPTSLRELLPTQDDAYRIPRGSKIIDLTFHSSQNKLNDCYEQALKYINNSLRCWDGIFTTYLKYKEKLPLTDKMSELVKRAIYEMLSQNIKVERIHENVHKKAKNADIIGTNNRPVEFLQIVVTYVAPLLAENGTKLTDSSGAKGVVGTIYPDEWMPVDEDGIRAEMLIDMSSPVSRNNPAQLYETGINRISEFVRRRVQATYDTTGVDDAFEVLVDWFNDVNSNYAELTRKTCKTTQDKKELVVDAITTGVKLWIPPFLNTLTPVEGEQWNALINIQTWAKKWGARRSRIRYKIPQPDGTIKEFFSRDVFAIGSKYIYHLNKLPEITAPGPAAVNHIGVPTKVTTNNKYFPVSNNPYRFGEDELRIMAMDADVREVTRFQNIMSNSPKGTALAIETLLLSEKPTAIKRFPISNGDLIKSSVILNLFHGVTATLGVETKRTRVDSGEREVSDDLAQSIWDAESIDKDGGDDGPGESSVAADRVVKKRARMHRFLGTDEDGDDTSVLDDTDVDDDE